MANLVFILTPILGVVAVLHVLWGIGFWFPIRDEERLVRCVVGAAGATRMPGPIPCALVAAAVTVVMFALLASPNWARTFVLWLSGIVFLARGVLAWVPMWRKMTPQEPFATLDRTLYGPMCLFLGAGILAVVLN